MALLTKLAFVVFVPISVGFIFPLTLTDFGYLCAYRSCDRVFQRQYEHDPRHKWFQVSRSTGHRLLTMLAGSGRVSSCGPTRP